VKSVYVEELASGDDLLNEPFLLQDVARRETKDGRPYLLCVFRDRTGTINGVFWDLPPDVEGWVKPGIVALVTGRVNNYRNALQITTTDLNPSLAPEMGDFLPASNRSVDEMETELRQVINSLQSPWQELLSHILLDPDFLPKYKNAPAARSMHHAYVGGTLEHTLSMVRIARSLIDHYAHINADLLISGILLHDMGKALEYETSTSFDFTDDGRLVGHIARAAIVIEKAADEVMGIADVQLRQLLHLVLSHHGTLEWGSPVVPKTIEAVILHQLDLLDSRVQGFFDHLHNDDSNLLWTGRTSYMFDTELRRPPGFE
jgi:3'-5' exoribonuclease